MWRCFSASVVLLFCALVCITTYMWDFLFNGQVSLTGSVCLAIQIKVFEFIFHAMALYLTECENYKYQKEWYDSFLWKKFVFYAVNSYYPFFYLSVIQGAAQGRCPAGDCIMLLRTKLVMTMTILTLLRIVEVVVQTMVLEFKMRWEAYQLRQSGMYAAGEEPLASFEERQAKSASYKLDAQVEGTLQLILPLGFVLIFSPTTPSTVVLCFILFAINMRAAGVLLTSSLKRPFPHRAVGIGAWSEVISFLMVVGVFANAFFLVQYGSAFQGTPVITKCAGILMFACCCSLTWKAVDIIVPKEAHDVQLMVQRRQHVLFKINHLHAAKAETVSARDRAFRKAQGLQTESALILEGRWDDVKLFPGATTSGESRA